MPWNRAHPRSSLVWSARLLAITAVLSAALLPLPAPLSAALLTVLWLSAAGTCLCYFPKRAAATRWRINPSGLTVQKGVLFCRALQIRAGQLQGVGRLCSPLGRVFGVETVFLYLPGRVWVLDGVSRADAERLEACARQGAT